MAKETITNPDDKKKSRTSSRKSSSAIKPDLVFQFEHMDSGVCKRILLVKDALHTLMLLSNEVWQFAHKQPTRYQRVLELIEEGSQQLMDIIH